tara:strand:- start:1240 stop:1899 length:660 start_codon:yes stop_codon:yes gene_type:complete
MKAKFTLAALCLLFAGAANAELIKTDYKTTGDELATLDTETGIEWLDISETAGYNLNEISALIAEGGELEGWRMPTQTEVTNLFMMLFDGNISSGENNSSSYASQIANLHDFFGYTSYKETANYDRAYGLYRRDDNGEIRMAGTRGSSIVFINYDHAVYSDTYTNAVYGTWLVSDGGTTMSSINNPALNANNPASPYRVPVEGIGLFGLAGLLLRRKSR